MNFKKFLIESAIPEWIKNLSNEQLNSYEKDHPDLHKETKQFIQYEIINRRTPQNVKSVKYKIYKKGRKWLEGKEIDSNGKEKYYLNKIELNSASSDFEVGETYTFNADIQWEQTKYGSTVKVFPVSKSQLEIKSNNDNKQEIEKWLEYIKNAVKEGYLYTKGVDRVYYLGIKKYPELLDKLKTYEKEIQDLKQKKLETPSYGKSWEASKDSGFCELCKKPILKNQEVRYQYLKGTKNLCHVDCDKSNKEREDIVKRKEDNKKYFNVGGGSGYGYSEYKVGDVIKAKQEQINKGYPEFLYVVSASKKYFSNDGLSFGVGDDEGYVYIAKCREATEEESKKLREKIENDKKVRKAKLRVEEIENIIVKKGEFPKGDFNLDGDKLFNTQNIYGGGKWFVIDKDYIWFVRNNGMDGDDWSKNNIKTGGAGALGWRIKYDEKIENELVDLEKIIKKNI